MPLMNESMLILKEKRKQHLVSFFQYCLQVLTVFCD